MNRVDRSRIKVVRRRCWCALMSQDDRTQFPRSNNRRRSAHLSNSNTGNNRCCNNRHGSPLMPSHRINKIYSSEIYLSTINVQLYYLFRIQKDLHFIEIWRIKPYSNQPRLYFLSFRFCNRLFHQSYYTTYTETVRDSESWASQPHRLDPVDH